MTLEAIYFIGQTVAAFAIVGSLIFVGIQSRQASRASELASLQVIQERFDGFRRMVVADKELVDLYDRGLRDPIASAAFAFALIYPVLSPTITCGRDTP